MTHLPMAEEPKTELGREFKRFLNYIRNPSSSNAPASNLTIGGVTQAFVKDLCHELFGVLERNKIAEGAFIDYLSQSGSEIYTNLSHCLKKNGLTNVDTNITVEGAWQTGFTELVFRFDYLSNLFLTQMENICAEAKGENREEIIRGFINIGFSPRAERQLCHSLFGDETSPDDQQHGEVTWPEELFEKPTFDVILRDHEIAPFTDLLINDLIDYYQEKLTHTLRDTRQGLLQFSRSFPGKFSEMLNELFNQYKQEWTSVLHTETSSIIKDHNPWDPGVEGIPAGKIDSLVKDKLQSLRFFSIVALEPSTHHSPPLNVNPLQEDLIITYYQYRIKDILSPDYQPDLSDFPRGFFGDLNQKVKVYIDEQLASKSDSSDKIKALFTAELNSLRVSIDCDILCTGDAIKEKSSLLASILPGLLSLFDNFQGLINLIVSQPQQEDVVRALLDKFESKEAAAIFLGQLLKPSCTENIS